MYISKNTVRSARRIASSHGAEVLFGVEQQLDRVTDRRLRAGGALERAGRRSRRGRASA
jgi:hypothetical protein